MNSRTRTFAKQVQIDLLALSDADLLHIIQQWVDGDPTDLLWQAPEESMTLLGYTAQATTDAQDTPSDAHVLVPQRWLAPDATRLRAQLTEMDVKIFIQDVIPLAFQAFHTTYPEWGEGLTFNAHLANYLRSLATKFVRSATRAI
jgi:hypothetical protein